MGVSRGVTRRVAVAGATTAVAGTAIAAWSSAWRSATPTAESAESAGATGAAGAETAGEIELPPLRKRTFWLAGDSICAQKYRSQKPETGWGMALPFYLAPGTTVRNRARGGRSSKSFVTEGLLDSIWDGIEKDDVLLISFGHNDQYGDPSERTSPWTSYQDYLARYVDGARARGAKPVLLSPVERRWFTDGGLVLRHSHGEYPMAMEQLALEKLVPYVDLNLTTHTAWQTLGNEASKRYFDYEAARDSTHLSPLGAGLVAQMVVSGLVAETVLLPTEVRRLAARPSPGWYRYT